MPSGRLWVNIGPMFAGKTTRLLDLASDMISLQIEYRLLKPSFDNRYSECEVVSHDGVSLPCLSISGLPDIEDGVEAVLIDEVQFFGMEIIPWVRAILDRDIDVCVAGLDMDWKGEPFVVSGVLAAWRMKS